jgi:hypothetical protein
MAHDKRRLKRRSIVPNYTEIQRYRFLEALSILRDLIKEGIDKDELLNEIDEELE